MTKWKLIAALLLSVACKAGAADVCAAPDTTKASVAIAASSTTKLVSGNTSSTQNITIHVCHYDFTAASGTAATYTFNYGTGTTCGTGTTALTGAYAGGSYVSTGAPSADVFVVPPGKDLCITMGGSGNSAQGVLTYTIQ